MNIIKEIEFDVDDGYLCSHGVEIQVCLEVARCEVCNGSGIPAINLINVSGYGKRELLYSICEECLLDGFGREWTGLTAKYLYGKK